MIVEKMTIPLIIGTKARFAFCILRTLATPMGGEINNADSRGSEWHFIRGHSPRLSCQ